MTEMKLGMEGVHQLSNAATAITAAAVLASEGILQGLTLEGLRLGLSRAQLPGRFQRCRLAEHRAGPVLIVDGAHTPEACAALAASLRRAFPEPSPVALVLAAAADKDARYHLGCGVCRLTGPKALCPACSGSCLRPETARAEHNVLSTLQLCRVSLASALIAHLPRPPHPSCSGMCAALGALRPVAVFPTEVEVAGSGARAMAPGSIMAAWQFNGAGAWGSGGRVGGHTLQVMPGCLSSGACGP